MPVNKSNINSWEDFFEYDYDLFSRSIELEIFINTIKKFVPKGESILETGFGSGATSILLAEMGYNVTAIDINEKLIENLKQWEKTLKNLSVKKSDMLKLPFKDNSFYAVIHQGVLEHFNKTQIESILHEQKRVSKKHIIFDIPNHRVQIHEHLNSPELLFHSKLTLKEWRKLIKKNGLSIKHEYGRGGYIYNLIPLGLIRADQLHKKRLKSLKFITKFFSSLFNFYLKWRGDTNGFVCEIKK